MNGMIAENPIEKAKEMQKDTQHFLQPHRVQKRLRVMGRVGCVSTPAVFIDASLYCKLNALPTATTTSIFKL